MKKRILISFLCLSMAASSWAAKLDNTTAGKIDASRLPDLSGTYATLATALVGSCTVGPCLDGTSDGGDLIKLYGALGYWTALQAGAAEANRSWRLPIGAPPSAGNTMLLNVDEYGQMGQLDPATFAVPADIPTESSMGVDDLKTLSGVADGTQHLGEFTGDTIPDDSDNKEALQALETAVETPPAAASIPVVDTNENFTEENVETVLEEIAGKVATNTEDIAAIVPVRHYGYWPIPIAGDLCSVDGVSPPDAVATHNEYPYRTYSSEADEDTKHRFDVPPDMMVTDTRTWFRVKCLVTAETGPSASEGIAFALQGVSGGHGDPTGYTKGDLAVSTIEGAADQWDLYVTDWAAVTIPGIAPGETAELKLLRDVSDAVDDYGQLIGAFLLEMRYVRFETEVAAP